MSALANAVEMVKSGAPRIIRNDEELHEYTDALFRLTAKDKPTKAEMDTIDLLTLLVTDYESKGRPVPEVSPIDVLRYLMDKQNLSQRDLVEVIGSDSLVSRILKGERNLTVAHMHALGERFHVAPAVFLGRAERRKVA
jgi:HTH-type transcriptional regulator / antitoxin HigA